jgi:ECF transporter S component (folate family)
MKNNSERPNGPKSAFFGAAGVFSPRNVVFMGMMLALCVSLNFAFTKYVSPDFKVINVSYVPGVAVAALLGPWAALAFGFAADSLKFLTFPQGGYAFGYAISEMVTYFIYSAFFFRRGTLAGTGPRKFSLKHDVPAAAFAFLTVTLVVTLGINYIWQRIYFGPSASFFSAGRMINRLIQFPLHVSLVALSAKAARLLGLRYNFVVK